jgi:hypothetical protein
VKQYKCVQVDHHNKIPQAINEYLSAGWVVHSYQAVCLSMTTNVRHYLLLEKDDSVSQVGLEKYLTEEELKQLRTDSRNPTIAEAAKLRTKNG